MKIIKINPGVCGFTTEVRAVTEDGKNVKLAIKSACANVRKLAALLGGEVDGYAACFGKCGGGPVYDAAREACRHVACPVPAGIVKCIEAECGLALPRGVEIQFVQADAAE
jgi:hypothetical protein